MNPKHTKAAHWIQKGAFDDLKSFEDFQARVNPVVEEKDRGDLFEIFIEGYLATQSITQWKQHWVVGDIPLAMREKYNLPKSQGDGTGIDGIYETHDGTHVAYQVKYRKAKHLTFGEVAPFLGITEKFSDRVIFTNASSLADNALVRTRWYSGDIFNELSEGALSQIEAWLKEKPLPIIRATPDPNYQVQALADIDRTFQTHDRATVVMACGTGKTLLALWAAEQAKPKTVLVLLPSLTLLQQTLKEWSQQTNWGSKFSYLCVCSDQTVGLKNDDININKDAVGFRVDTDPTVVRKFLERKTDDTKVIFSTYHSTGAVAEGCKGLAPFDLGIFDEAHKTTGRTKGGEESYFTYALSDEWVPIKKRLFLTATPRHIDIRHRDKEGEFKVQSMDNETIYGPRAHTLSFGAAVKKGIICPYKVIISLIDKKMVDDFTRKNGITLIEGGKLGAPWVSNLIALDQAVKKVDAKKIITFHSRVQLAQEFAKNEPRGIAHYLNGYDVRHVNGSQNSGERDQLIKAFATSLKGLITNARCLTEGVNIPSVDMVAFIDPRQSKVDITQAVGRAMRKPRGATTKTVGYVLVPLFAGMDGESLDDAIKTERFHGIADVLNALQEHDEELVDVIRELRQSKGEGKVFNPKRLLEKLEFIGPAVGFDELVQSISVAITDQLGSSWDEWYGSLVKYREIYKDSKPPLSFATSIQNGFATNGAKLGSWVSRQREERKKGKLTKLQIEKLDELKFVWSGDVLDDRWRENFNSLVHYKRRYNNLDVPRDYITKLKEGFVQEDFPLGSWVKTQRSFRRNDILPQAYVALLEEQGFDWQYSRAESWEINFFELRTFVEIYKNCDVPLRFETSVEDGFKKNGKGLADWVLTQRKMRKKGAISPDRIHRLDGLGFVWDTLAREWDNNYSDLVLYKELYGDCVVPLTFRTSLEAGFKSSGRALANWVVTQRKNFAKGILTNDRVSHLNEIDFAWKAKLGARDPSKIWIKRRTP
jgi:superfamily II DNA or RNA helicase